MRGRRQVTRVLHLQQRNPPCNREVLCIKCLSHSATVWAFLVKAPYNERTHNFHGGTEQRFCKECMLQELFQNDNVVGFLDKIGQKQYKADAKLSLQYRRKGYIVLHSDKVSRDWGLARHFPGNIKALLEDNKSKIANLGNEDKGLRKWVMLKTATVKGMKTDYSSLISDRIIHTDIYWGRVAAQNAIYMIATRKAIGWDGIYKKCREEIEVKGNDWTLGMSCACLLYRGEGMGFNQRVHADTEPGNYHGVFVATPDYEIHLFPGTHLLHKSRSEAKDNKYFVTVDEQKTLKLKVGDLLLFQSSLGHCGGRSNDRNTCIPLGFDQDSIDIKWFSEKNSKKRVTDMALHFDLQDKFCGDTPASSYSTGRVELMRLGVIQYDDPGYRESFQIFAKKSTRQWYFSKR